MLWTFLLSLIGLRLKSFRYDLFRITYIIIIFALTSNSALSDEFKIISFKGVVEISSNQKIWDVVKEEQIVKTGSWIRTGPKASAIILLPNRTQTKISRNAEFQLNYKSKEQTNSG